MGLNDAQELGEAIKKKQKETEEYKQDFIATDDIREFTA